MLDGTLEQGSFVSLVSSVSPVSPGSPTGSPVREHLGILLVLQIHNIEPTYIISILKPFYRAALKKICSGIPDLRLRLKMLRTAIKNLTLLY